MKKITFNWVAIFVITSVSIFFNSCSKYEEGPGISLRSADARVTGDWKVESYTINGVDQLNITYSDYLICADGDFVFYDGYDITDKFVVNMSSDGTWKQEWSYKTKNVDYDFSYDNCNDYYDYGNFTDFSNGTWKLNSDKTKLELTTSGTLGKETYDIIELREKRMKLEGRIDGELHKLIFVKN